MIAIEHDWHRDVILIRASGTLTTEDDEHAVPEFEHAMDLSDGPLRGKLRLEDFRGWEIGALWHELEFDLEHGDLEHGDDVGRIAVIGETRLEDWGTTLSAPFTRAGMRFFPAERETAADTWLTDTGEGRGGAA